MYCRGQQELHTISSAIQNTLSSSVSVALALKGIQKTLGKPLPFKVRYVTQVCRTNYTTTDMTLTFAVCFFLFVFLQLESVAECYAHLCLLSKALDIRDLRLNDGTPALLKQEVARLRGVAMRTDCKEALLEGWGLVMQANLLLDPQSTCKFTCSP